MILNKPPTVLIVEDDENLAFVIREFLYDEMFEVLVAHDGWESLGMFRQHQAELVLLDVRLPRIDGLEVCRRIRATSDVPIIMLTCMARELDIVRGLEAGADDYVTKPFSKCELVARIRAALRRGNRVPGPSSTIHVDDRLSVDPARGEVRVEGQRVNLSPIEYKLFISLFENAGRICTCQSLLTRVWGWEYSDSVEYLKVHICHLRKKIEPEPQKPRYIQTERGLGYRFVSPDHP